MLLQLGVERCDEQLDVGVRIVKDFDALGCSHQREEFDRIAVHAPLLEHVDGVRRTRVTGDKVELHMQAGDRLVPRIVLSAERQGFELLDVSIAEPSLETVFISLTGRELRED